MSKAVTLKKSFYGAGGGGLRNKCKHPVVIKTSFGQLYCPNCKRNVEVPQEQSVGINRNS